ncbi:hypothetical protein R3P38DRAFT_2868621 [Favolaschia claudopus]|uniref:F-box domain-containing protein n=1 Tax=Favolaschia claudopus TaxID=2862362 RepID=A0AAW0DAK4_9AGAR
MAQNEFAARLSADLTQRVLSIIAENPTMTPEDAVRQAQDELLAQAEANLFHKITDLETRNNPFRPPTHGCPVNDLPPELLAHIFMFGCKMDDEDAMIDEGSDGDGEEDDDEWETDDEEGEADEEVVEDGDVRMGSPSKPANFAKMRARKSGPPLEDSASLDSGSDFEDDDDDDDHEVFLPFQVLVSHVCKHWREIALGTHTLWTTIRLSGHINVDKSAAWLARAGGLPLDIFIDATDMHDPAGHDHDHPPEDGDAEDADTAHAQPPGAWPADNDPAAAPNHNQVMSVVLQFNPHTGTLSTSTHLVPEEDPQPCLSLDDLKAILDMLVPHVAQWRILEVTTSLYKYMYEVLARIAQLPGAPLLEELGLYNYEENELEEDENFQPADLAEAFVPFSANAPLLTHVAFWGVHAAWENTLPMLTGLKEIELAYHTKDVRLSFECFRAMIDNSPELDLLSLCCSAPTGDFEPFAIPSLKALILCELDMDIVKPLVAALELPALDELTLELLSEDYSEFATQLAGPARGQTRSLLAGLSTLKLAGLECNIAACEAVMGQLDAVKRFHLKCLVADDDAEDAEDQWFKRLKEVEVKPDGTSMRYCPKLENLRIEGVAGASLKELVELRKTVGAPIAHISVGNLDVLEEEVESWLRSNVAQFDYFDPSDDEEDELEVEDPMVIDTE